MKSSYRALFSIAIAVIMFSCCKEIGPNINLSGNGTDTTGGNVDSSQQKTVLIENFTGASCSNCPKGAVIIDNLVAQYPGRFEVVEVHEGALSDPVFPSDPNLVTPDGSALDPYLGPVPFWPSAAIDRKLYEVAPGDFERCLDRNLWSTYAPQQLDSPLLVKLGLNFAYDDAMRKLSGSVTVNFFKDIPDALNITVLITEDGIVAGQVDGLEIDTFYVHRHVLHDIITGVQGDPVTGAKTTGSSWTYSISPYTLPEEWNADSCRVIAFVSKAAGSFDVLQARGKALK